MVIEGNMSVLVLELFSVLTLVWIHKPTNVIKLYKTKYQRHKAEGVNSSYTVGANVAHKDRLCSHTQRIMPLKKEPMTSTASMDSLKNSPAFIP